MQRNEEWELQEEEYNKISTIPYRKWISVARELIEEYTQGGQNESYEFGPNIDRGKRMANCVDLRIDFQEYCTVMGTNYANLQIQINNEGKKKLGEKNIKVPDKSSVALVLIPVGKKIPYDKVREAFEISCFSGKDNPKRKVTIIPRRA